MVDKNKALKEKLSYLKLIHIRDNYTEMTEKAARKKMSNLDFLSEIICEEVAEKHNRATERRLRRAKIPYRKTLEQFKWTHPDKINRSEIENIFRLHFIEENKNIVFLGRCGTGKTHLATALAAKACSAGYNTLFSSAVDIINSLTAAKAVNNFQDKLQKYIKTDLLIIDELGYLPVDRHGAEILYQIIAGRYERGSIVITSNRPYNKWVEIFDNNTIVTSAVLDRIIHHCHTVKIEGSSFRMNERKKS